MWGEFPHSAFLSWQKGHLVDIQPSREVKPFRSSRGQPPFYCLLLPLFWWNPLGFARALSKSPFVLDRCRRVWRRVFNSPPSPHITLLNNWASHEHFILGRLLAGVTHIAPTGVWEAWECEGEVKPLIWKSPLAAAFFSPTLIEDAKLLLCVFGIRQIGSADQ